MVSSWLSMMLLLLVVDGGLLAVRSSRAALVLLLLGEGASLHCHERVARHLGVSAAGQACRNHEMVKSPSVGLVEHLLCNHFN